MKCPKISLTLVIALASAACGGAETKYGAAGGARNNNAASSSGASSAAAGGAAPAPDVASGDAAPPIASAHGGRGTAPQGSTANSSAEKPDLDTPELDARIEKAEATSRAKNATDADRRALAAAYLERGNVFYGAQQPRLYKFALGDFRRALRYDPANEEAAYKIAQIEAIYRSLNKPIPDNGTE